MVSSSLEIFKNRQKHSTVLNYLVVVGKALALLAPTVCQANCHLIHSIPRTL
jgi:hypothetical protein